MKIIALVNSKKALVEMDSEELGQISKFGGSYALGLAMPNLFHYGEFKKEIVGTEIPIAAIYKEAVEVLKLHKDAVGAAEQLKRSSSKFLGFLQNEEETKK